MLRKQSAAKLLFLLLSLLLVVPQSGEPKEKARKRMMRFAGTAEIDNNLLLISGVVGPASFFNNLHSLDSSQGTIIMNDLGEVKFFPERLMITANIVGPLPIKGKGKPPQGLAVELMQGLEFKVQWKRGMKLRPVREFRMLTASETQFPNDLLGDPLGLFTYGWTYELVLARGH